MKIIRRAFPIIGSLGLLFFQALENTARAAAEVEVTCVFTNGRVEKTLMPLVQAGTVQRFRWEAEQIPAGVRQVEVRAAFATAQTGEPGYFVMPNGFLGTFRERDGEQKLGASYMPLFGMQTPRATFAAIVTGLPHEYTLVARAKNGVYTLFPRFELGGCKANGAIAIEFHFLTGGDANYSGMARAYRKFQLERQACVPLQERIKGRPGLAYALKCPEVRIRMGWKPAPSPVEEQTPATEPPMKVAVTFDRAGDILDECKRQGIERAEFCLVGWNQKGHDGRYPQLFPVEEALGGEARLRALTAKAQQLGYQMVCHNNHSDAYCIADSWNEEFIIKNPDGSLSKNASWSGGRMYNLCPQRAWELFAPKDLRAIAALGFHGVHYIDVLSIVRPRACHDPRHPLTPDQSAVWINKIMHEARDVFGGVSSEGAFDFCCGNLDYALYVSFGNMTNVPKLVDRVVPLWQLVYHGIVMSNPFTDTANYTLKGPVARLKLVEFGGRPMFYFHSKFLEGNKQWMGAEDLTCADQPALAASVAQIKAGYDEYAALCRLQTAFMESHDQLAPDVTRTAYSEGTVIVCNYRDSAFEFQGKPVKPRDYLVLPGGSFQ